ncbi:MAG: alpha-L-rhamnosidase N-terminal domain-containing protein [Saprospiraceae bacterium]
MSDKLSRRGFISGTSTFAASAATLGWLPALEPAENTAFQPLPILPLPQASPPADKTLNLAPAQWIWYPARRILPNTFFHFRRNFNIIKPIQSAKGWIVGDSRYVLFCNGKRVQFGPAPSDPRFTEVDPVDLKALLQTGMNVIGATVLYYGFGDGTWPAGKAGFIFKLDVEYTDGSKEQVVSDDTWRVQLAKSWKPGMYKRWYLRALQESFDNRQYPHGWAERDFKLDDSWKTAAAIGGSADKTALQTSIPDYLYDSGSPTVSQLRQRSIPIVQEIPVPVQALVESHLIHWKVPPEEYFDLVTAEAFTGEAGVRVDKGQGQSWTSVLPEAGKGLVLTFELTEQVVGFPYFSMEAPAGTTVELLVQQGHVPFDKGGPALINNNLNSWTRFICKEGLNNFMTFDYESVKWLQLHIHGATGAIKISNPGVLRRVYPFPATPTLTTSDPILQKLFSASFNTVLNNSQDTIVDCMGRERQQYSGDIGHVVHILHQAYHESSLPARFINTFSQGITLDGFFMDSWPAYDRLNRLAQRQLGLTPWGPLLDHGVGFNYDVWYHYLYSGKKEDLEEVFPRLVRFFQYLQTLWSPGNLLPIENLGVPTVWMDTDSYKMQRHKQCAFNLYVAGMLQDAFANVCKAFGESVLQQQALEMSQQLVKTVRQHFWSTTEGILINNLPWHKEEGELRTCERSIAQFILSGFSTENEQVSLVKELVETPLRFGLCYPPNAQWRHWALAACGQIQPVLDEFRTKWIQLAAVQQNNTMPETWNSVPDTHAQYSHASLAPIYLAYMGIAGVTFLEPGGRRIKIQPQPADIEQFTIQNHTPQGPVAINWSGSKGKRVMAIEIPSGVRAELWLDEREKVKLKLLKKEKGKHVYELPAGTVWKSDLKFT